MLIRYAFLKKTAAKAKEEGFCNTIFTQPPEDRQSGDRKSEDRLCECKDAFRDFVPSDGVDPLCVKAAKPSQRLEGANKNE
ncbi:MAG: hypothetical protein JW999_11335 [Methanotrichaceae archaeon]|nr:hypothetical protein [Methanotrichaceae archaeon]